MADQNFLGTLSVSGNVGIGTEPLPNAQLYIRSAIEQSQILVENSAGSLLKLSVTNSEVTLGTDSGTTLPLSLQTNGVSRLSINSAGAISIPGSLTVQETLSVSGNVGIGTDTPSQRLDVAGTVRATTFQGDGSALTGVQVPDGSITTARLANSTVTNPKLANGAVDANKLANSAIAKRHIQNDAVAIAQLSASLVFDGQVALKGKSTAINLEQTPPNTHRLYLVSLACISVTFPPGLMRGMPPNIPIPFPVTFNWKHQIFVQPQPVPAGIPSPVVVHLHQVLIENPSPASAITLTCKVYRLDEN